MKVGDEVILESPYRVLDLGNPDCSIRIKNGAKGQIVAIPRGHADVMRVNFAPFSDRVTVAVPIHWLARRGRAETDA